MPATKGKRRHGSRRRGTIGPPDVVETKSTGSKSAVGARPKGWRRKPTPRLDLGLGVLMLVAGFGFFFFFQMPKSTLQTRLILLALYCLLGGFYLGRAFLHYRRQRQQRDVS